MTRTRIIMSLVLAAVAAFGQTKIDLGRQARNVDFTTAAFTRPFRMASALPVGCQPGEAVFRTDTLTGAMVFICTQPNVWNPVGTGGGNTAAGTGIMVADGRVSIDTAVVPQYLAGSAVLTLWNVSDNNIPAGQCRERVMVVEGASVNDGVAPIWPGQLPTQAVAMMSIVTDGEIVVKVCNLSSNTLEMPANLRFGAILLRTF
jgi:hypothetical protein